MFNALSEKWILKWKNEMKKKKDEKKNEKPLRSSPLISNKIDKQTNQQKRAFYLEFMTKTKNVSIIKLLLKTNLNKGCCN